MFFLDWLLFVHFLGQRKWPEQESGLPAGSRLAWRFTSLLDRSQAVGFFSSIFWDKENGQNRNRTSDTRIFRPVKAFPAVAFDFSKSTKTVQYYES
jgi:hypothetical protein